MKEWREQLTHIWNQITVSQRVSLVASVLTLVAGMGALLWWSSRPQMRMLTMPLDPKDQASVIAKIEAMDVPYEIRQGGAIYVPKDAVYRLRMDLASDGLPTGGMVGFEIFDEGNFGVSDFVQRTNYLRAVQGELSRTITQMRGIRSARVMVVQPENRLLLTGVEQKAKASVSVDTGGRKLDEEAVNSIRFLVANAVEGLVVDDVAVIDTQGNFLSEGLMGNELVGAASGQLRFRQGLEAHFTNKIESMLTPVVGPGNVVARVAVEVETEARTEVKELYDPKGTVVRSQTVQEEDAVSSEARGGGDVVGVAPNTPGDQPGGGAGNGLINRNEQSSKNRTTNYEINRTTTEVVRTPGEVNRITAAVFVAQRERVGEGGVKEPFPRTAEELEALRRMVQNALGVGALGEEGRVGVVTLEEMPFQPMMPQPTMEERVLRWFDATRNFLAVGVAVIMFIIFLRLLKRNRPDPYALEVVEEEKQRAAARQADVTPHLTAELLNELIREKPENVSTALKKWALEENPNP